MDASSPALTASQESAGPSDYIRIATNALESDIICVCETHLSGKDVISIEGYSWYGFNRQDIHYNAPKSSGGVGILVKTCICESFNVEIVDRSFDGILALRFTNKTTEEDLIVVSCYLPPEHSTRGRDAQSFLAHLLMQIYNNCDSDSIFVCGDFNARIGNLRDTISECDTIPDRRVLDTFKNQHGQDFVDFLSDAILCVLNGRFADDEYTSISQRGKAVVDYLCVPHDTFLRCKTFKVLTVSRISEQHGLHGLLGNRSRLPDHSVIVTDFYCQRCCDTDSDQKSVSDDTVRFKLRQIPVDFMTSEIASLAIFNLITKIEASRETQEDIDCA